MFVISTPSMSRFWSSSFSAARFFCSCRAKAFASSLWAAALLFSYSRRLNSRVCSFCTPFRLLSTSAARSSLPAAAAATSRLCFWMPWKMVCTSVISFRFITSPSIRPASSTLASSYSATSAKRLIILGLMASCTFISTSSHSVLSMLAAPATPAFLAAVRNNAAAPSFIPPTLRVSFTMLSYCSTGFPSRYPASRRSCTPWLLASFTAAPQVPYRRASSASAWPPLATV